MVTNSVLVTGGAGFIGSHLTRALIEAGHEVKVLDNLDPQAHAGRLLSVPQELLIRGDVREPETFKELLPDVDVIYHQAAAVGVGQSMYEIGRYVENNSLGTANLLQSLASSEHGVKRLIVASSNTVYGEGRYLCPNCGPVSPRGRSAAQLRARKWDPLCESCGTAASPLPTDEDKPLRPANVYAITKRDEEELCLVVGKAYGIPAVALRYFNVLGPGQSLANPYTGVYAVFLSRIRDRNPPVVYEDGRQTRDFVSVHDIVQANLLAAESSRMEYGSYNVGTGRATTILEVAHSLISMCGADLEPRITGEFREGDIRHCFADISKISEVGYAPKVTFEEALTEFYAWSEGQPSQDLFEKASAEMDERGLVR